MRWFWLILAHIAAGEQGRSASEDFDLSKLFYEALGFEKTFDDEVALFNAGSGRCVWGRCENAKEQHRSPPVFHRRRHSLFAIAVRSGCDNDTTGWS